jgi:hypothetical protein
MIALIWFLSLSIAFLCGVALGSALCHRRWEEKCGRCQRIIHHSRFLR